MPYLEDTRTSKLNADFTFNYKVWNWSPTAIVDPDFESDNYKPTWTFSGHLGFSVTCSIHDVRTQPGGVGTPWNYEAYLRCVTNNGHGVSNTVDILLDSATNIPASTQYYTLSGAYEGYHEGVVGTDILWDITEAANPITINYALFPRYTTYNWYERSTSGSTASMTTSVTGKGSATASGTVGATRPTANYEAVLDAFGFNNSTTNHYLNLTNVKINTVAVYDVSHSNSIGGQSATEWTYSIQTGSEPSPRLNCSADISSYVSLTRKVNVRGVVKSWTDPYNAQYDVDINGFDKTTLGYRRVTGNTGSWGDSTILHKYNVTTILTDDDENTNTVTTNLDEVPNYIDCNAVLATFDGGDLFTAADALYVRFRGWRFDGLLLKQTSDYTIDLESNDKNYTTYPNLSGYRFLHFNVRRTASGAQNFTIEITEQPGSTIKTWDLSTDSITMEEKIIDLCSPHNITVETDPQDDPYPRLNLTNAAYDTDEQKNAAYYGVSRISRIRVSSNSANVELGTAKLETDYRCRYNFMPSGYWHQVQRITKALVSESDTTTTYYTRRFWHQDTDGRNEEESDVWWQKTVGGSTGVTTFTLQPRTIKDLCDDINAVDTYPVGGNIVRHPGWTATKSISQGSGCSVPQPALSPCYLNGDTGYATWINGSGYLAMPDDTAPFGTRYDDGIDIENDATNGKTIKAQTIFNRINGDFIPDIPDPFDVVDEAAPVIEEGLYLRAVTVIRGCAHGLMLDNNGDILTFADQDVKLYLSSDNSLRGTSNSTSANAGHYETGTPFAKGDRDHAIKYKLLTINKTPIHWAKKHKGSFKEKADEGDKLSADKHKAGNQVYAQIKDGKANLMFTRAYNQTNWEEKTTNFTASDIEVKWKANTPLITLIMVIVNAAGNIIRYETTDFGGTWSVATTISNSGKNPSMCISPHGMEYYFWYDGGAIKRLKRDYVGNTVTAASNIVASGVADNDIACYWRDGVVAVFYRESGTNAIKIVTSNDNGETFS